MVFDYYFYHMLRLFLLITALISCRVWAQQQVLVPLTDLSKDERFEKFNLNVALFELKHDTILSWDFEGLKEPKPLIVKKPAGYTAYAYGYLFYGAFNGEHSQGFIPVVIGNPYHANAHLFADLNNNLDFTDDNFKAILPARGDTSLVTLCLPNQQQCVNIRFIRHQYDANFKYKDLMNEFYQTTYPERKFIGMEHCYREQRYQVKSGVMVSNGDTFKIGLYDGNFNGIYNEPEVDRMVMANIDDTIFYAFDDLYSSAISSKKGTCFIDKNGKQYEFVSALQDGSNITVNVLNQTSNEAQIKPGKKLPRFKFIMWDGKRKKYATFRRFHTYIYFGNPQGNTFTEDTLALRELSTKYKDKLRIIGFVEVQKSYELKIYGQYWQLNWMLAYKDKELNKKLGIRGIPSSIYTKKRRRVIQYNLSPTALLHQLNEQGIK